MVSNQSEARSRHDCISGNVVHARPDRRGVCPVPRRGEGQQAVLRGSRGVAAAAARETRDAVAAAVPAGAGGAGDRVLAHEPDVCGAGRGVRGFRIYMLAGRQGGDQRAGGPGPADQPGRRGAAGGQDGLGLPHRRRGARTHGDLWPENRWAAGLLLRHAQAARAERADRLLPRRRAAVGRRPGPPARPWTSPRRARPGSPPCSPP